MRLREDANRIIENAIKASLPDNAVKKGLEEIDFEGRTVHLVAVGKAAWQMSKAAYDAASNVIKDGFVITKYNHSKGNIGNLEIFEAGHPVPDDNTFNASAAVIEAAKKWSSEDVVLFLISGGGSALFEAPLVDKEELQDITGQLLACGADITEINIIRKRLSSVKGGRFAQICAPAKVYSVILSDVLGDQIDMIASGPAYPDRSTCGDAWNIVKKYNLKLSEQTQFLLNQETPKELDNVETIITGSVSQLCVSAEETARSLGYEPVLLSDMISCTARDAGEFLAAIAKTHVKDEKNLAYIVGGETVVKLTGKGLGGRNQELALAAAPGISGLKGVAVFSIGSDGTDGPTDAAGGYVDWQTQDKLKEQGIIISDVLAQNDSYHALEKCEGLIMTGPTGTNVNDISVLLIKTEKVKK